MRNSAIIYLAAISSIDPQLYEAAVVDGAGRFRRMLSITVPLIMPTVVVLLILGVGRLLSGGVASSNFNQAYLLGNDLIISNSDVLETYTLRMGLQLGRFSFAAASGLIRAILNFALLILANESVKKLGHGGIW